MNAAAQPSLGQTTARGFFWMAAQSLGSRVVTFLSQIVLAWLLMRDEFGLVAKTTTVTALVGVIHITGLRDVLVQRHASLKRIENAAFWLSLVLGLLSAAILVAAAPLAVRIYDSPELFGLILVAATGAIPDSLAHVPMARLQAQLRFRFLAALNLAVAVGTPLLSIVFAAAGFGPYALILPLPIVSLARLIVLMRVATPRLRRRLQWRRWPMLMSGGATIMASAIAMTIVDQADYAALGLFHDDDTVGVYFFAFLLSMQATRLITQNLGQVIFPALSQLQDQPRRQTDAFLRAARLLALVGVPTCLIQAAAADPGIRALFEDKWIPAIPVLQALSIGMAFRLVVTPGYGMLKAQGRFGALLAQAWIFAIAFVIGVVVAAAQASEATVALAVAVVVAAAWAIYGPATLYQCIRSSGVGFGPVARVYAAPLAAGAVATVAALAAAAAAPDYDWIRLGLTVVVFVAVYLAAALILARQDLMDLWSRLRGVLGPRGSVPAPVAR